MSVRKGSFKDQSNEAYMAQMLTLIKGFKFICSEKAKITQYNNTLLF
jgi:hypothetical protein